MADGQEQPKRNPTIPILPEEEISFMESIQPLFEPPIPPLHEFVEEGWWKAPPDTPEADIKMLWLRYKQTAIALAVACKSIIRLEARVEWLEANQKSTVQ